MDCGYLDWPGAQQLIRLERKTVERGQVRQSVTYAITSLPRSKADAKFLLKHLRGRWAIENSCFYILDNSLGEDGCRVRTGNAAHALSSVRHMAINFAKRLRKTATQLCQQNAANVYALTKILRIMKN